jgi:hypothetical protein
VAEGVQELLLQRPVLAFEVQHGNRLSGSSRRTVGGRRSLHPFILPVALGRVTRRR